MDALERSLSVELKRIPEADEKDAFPILSHRSGMSSERLHVSIADKVLIGTSSWNDPSRR